MVPTFLFDFLSLSIQVLEHFFGNCRVIVTAAGGKVPLGTSLVVTSKVHRHRIISQVSLLQ